jgi:hypothetical protein
MKQVIVSTTGLNSVSYDEMMEVLGQVNQDRVNAINAKTAFIADRILQVTKNVAGKNTIKILQDADVKVAGLCDINGGKLEKGEIFLVSGIMLLSAVGTGNSLSDAAALEFTQIAKELRNGTFEFKANSKTIVPLSSTEAFVNHRNVVSGTGTTAPIGTGFVGHYKLSSPQLIETQAPIEFNLEFAAAPVNYTFVKLILIGSAIVNK